MKMLCVLILALSAVMMPAHAHAQSKPAGGGEPADNMQILRDKLMADKKLVVAANMALTEGEAKAFWPLYEQYQKELHQINDRTAMLLVGYSNAYGTNNLTDEKAKALLENYFEIEEAEIKLKRSFVPKLSNVLPGVKVARYMQLENKIRAIVKYELAREVPLAQ